MKNKLFVGNISWDVTNEELGEFFSQVGTVLEAIIITDRQTNRSKGFGFVTMETEEEAQEAIETLDGKELDGRAINVDIAKPQNADNKDRNGGCGKYNEFLIDGFLDEDKCVKENLISPLGEFNVKDLAEKLNNESLKSSQLRKFYDRLTKIQNAYKNRKDDSAVVEELLVLNSLVAYSAKYCGDMFVCIFKNRVEIVVDEKNKKDFSRNLEAFWLHMQALVAYLK